MRNNTSMRLKLNDKQYKFINTTIGKCKQNGIEMDWDKFMLTLISVIRKYKIDVCKIKSERQLKNAFLGAFRKVG